MGIIFRFLYVIWRHINLFVKKSLLQEETVWYSIQIRSFVPKCPYLAWQKLECFANETEQILRRGMNGLYKNCGIVSPPHSYQGSTVAQIVLGCFVVFFTEYALCI